MRAGGGGLGNIGRYELLAELGAGGMGRVYLGRHMDTGWRRAIKTMAVDGDEYPELEERFIREVQAASRVRHENVVAIYDLGRDTDNGLMYYIMEHLEGEDLATRLDRRGPLAWQEVRDILIQIARGLHAAHAEGVVHRDIKPHNCVAVGTEREVIKVIDFGICKDVRPEGERLPTITGHVIGSPVYISPEQALGKKDIDLRTDIYSLGVTAYQLLVGEPPFRGEVGELIVAHVNTPPRSLREHPAGAAIPRALDDIVLGCLAKRREDRPGSMRELEEALVAVQAEAAATDTAAVATRRWRRSGSSRVLPALAWSLGVLGAAIGLMLVVMQRADSAGDATQVKPLASASTASPQIAAPAPVVAAVASPAAVSGVDESAAPKPPPAPSVDGEAGGSPAPWVATKGGRSGAKPASPRCLAGGWSHVKTRMKALAEAHKTQLPGSLEVSFVRSGDSVKVSVPGRFARTSTEEIAQDAFVGCKFGSDDPRAASKVLVWTQAVKPR